MLTIILANFGFWFNLLIPIAIALYLAFTHREYIWKEFGIQTGVTAVYVSIMYTLLFSVTTDLIDKEYWSGKVSSFTYFEEWKEKVTYTESYSCGSSKNPRTCTRTKTRIDYHSPYYEILTSNAEKISIKRRDYLNASSRFGHKEVDLYRANQVSWGDGDKYVSYPSTIIPTSVAHSYENYVAAAKGNVIHTKVPQKIIDILVKKGKLREYPILYRSSYGSTRLNRFIDTTGLTKVSYLEKLNSISVNIGDKKQANPIIYLTKEDRSFKDALEQYWSKGKKNDITLILGLDDSGNIVWSDTITFTNNTDFIVDLQNDYKDLNINTDRDILLGNFNTSIMKSYIRKPMKQFEYLKENITLEWYWQLLIFLGNLGISGFVTYKMLTNYDRKSNYR